MLFCLLVVAPAAYKAAAKELFPKAGLLWPVILSSQMPRDFGSAADG